MSHRVFCTFVYTCKGSGACLRDSMGARGGAGAGRGGGGGGGLRVRHGSVRQPDLRCTDRLTCSKGWGEFRYQRGMCMDVDYLSMNVGSKDAPVARSSTEPHSQPSRKSLLEADAV